MMGWSKFFFLSESLQSRKAAGTIFNQFHSVYTFVRRNWSDPAKFWSIFLLRELFWAHLSINPPFRQSADRAHGIKMLRTIFFFWFSPCPHPGWLMVNPFNRHLKSYRWTYAFQFDWHNQWLYLTLNLMCFFSFMRTVQSTLSPWSCIVVTAARTQTWDATISYLISSFTWYEVISNVTTVITGRILRLFVN